MYKTFGSGRPAEAGERRGWGDSGLGGEGFGYSG